MKSKLIAISVIATLSAPVMSMTFKDLLDESKTKQDGMDLCQSMEWMAEEVMRKRQEGDSLSTALKIVDGRDIVEDTIMRAYSHSIQVSRSEKKRVVSEFSTAEALPCYQAVITKFND